MGGLDSLGGGGGGEGGGKAASSSASSTSGIQFGNITDGEGNINPLALLALGLGAIVSLIVVVALAALLHAKKS